MRKLSDEISLSGKLEEITVTDLRKQPGAVLTSVELGKVFVISKNGKFVAVLSKVPGVQLAIEVDKYGRFRYAL